MKLLMNRRIHKSKGDRRVTWLELFFDLVTVVAISRLGLLLIVLGEVILATINGIAGVHLNGTGIATGLAGFAIAAVLWTCLVLVVGLALPIRAESQFLPAEKSSGV